METPGFVFQEALWLELNSLLEGPLRGKMRVALQLE